MPEKKHRLLYYWFRKDKEENPMAERLEDRLRADRESFLLVEGIKEKSKKERKNEPGID